MAGVYISYPFCNQKCTFCNFASSVGVAGSRTAYHDVLCAEIRNHRWQWTPETIYLGGGTPSLLEGQALREVLDGIPREKVVESTMECAPGTLTDAAAGMWKGLGINRVSLGVQSFHDRELRQTGRTHTAQTVESDVTTLRAAGLDNINVDLIAGLPHQTKESWEESLDWTGRLGPPHVSVYLFEVDDDSRLGREVILGGARYGAAHIPSEEASAEFYERACERLASLGYERYEISNFARPGFASRHNLKYWQLEPYVGFGLDAHSFDGEKRWGNADLLAEYLAGGSPRRREPVDREEEHFFVGLRLMEGIEPTMAERRRFAEPIARWLHEGMMEEDGAVLRLSARGVLLSNEIFADFVNA